MGKASKVKGERDTVVELVSLIQVLKDVADNKFHALAAQKDRFARFGESFVEFFRLISFADNPHLLIKNDNQTVCIVVITSEAGFLGDLNSRVIRAALSEKSNHPNSSLVVVGKKAVAQLGATMSLLKTFEETEIVGLYETASQLKDFLVNEVMQGRIGRVIAIYPWPKSLSIVKPRVVKLLPCDELISKQSELVDKIEKVIEESNPMDIIGRLSDMWLSCKIYEMLYDMTIAAAAAQSAQLENSLNKMQKEKKVVQLKYRKARKGDIDNSLREIFSARMMTMRHASAKKGAHHG